MGPSMTEGQQAHVGNSGADGRGGTSVVPPGVWVDDSDEDDPVLRKADGSLVDTWREEYPYTERMTREEYDHLKRALQVELLRPLLQPPPRIAQTARHPLAHGDHEGRREKDGDVAK